MEINIEIDSHLLRVDIIFVLKTQHKTHQNNEKKTKSNATTTQIIDQNILNNT